MLLKKKKHQLENLNNELQREIEKLQQLNIDQSNDKQACEERLLDLINTHNALQESHELLLREMDNLKG